MEFLDYFSQHAGLYAEFRPTYPDTLFDHLSILCEERGLAWDCATGNGQAAEGLSRRFRSVIGSDGSKEQIQHAKRLENVDYFVAIAEQAPLQDELADLVTIAQALHWLRHEAFFKEVTRVLKPNGVVAAWCYNLLEVEPAIDSLLLKYYWEIVGPYWAPERRLLELGYRTIPFPFVELPASTFYMEADWNLADLIGYLRTWSATQKFMSVKQSNPVDLIFAELSAVWGEPQRARPIRWPLSLRVGRKK